MKRYKTISTNGMRLNNELLLLIVAFAAGTMFGFILNPYIEFEVENKLVLSDFISVLASCLVAIYLGTIIAGRQTSSRFEKEFLINEAKHIIEFVDSSEIFSSTETINFKDAISTFKTLNRKIFNYENTLKAANHCRNLNLDEIRSAFTTLRKTITGLSPRPKDSIIVPSKQDRFKIVDDFSNFRVALFKKIVEINSYDD